MKGERETHDTHGAAGEPWYGFDLDGTLARYDGWRGIDHIGEPVAPVCAIARRLHAEGKIVRIVTARVAPRPSDADLPNPYLAGNWCVDYPDRKPWALLDRWTAREFIQDWCHWNLGFVPEITHQKDPLMLWLVDDRTVQVEPNTGRVIGMLPPEMREAQSAHCPETVAAILREMRGEGGGDVAGRMFREYADRLDAALARDAGLADDDQWAPRHEAPTSPAPTAKFDEAAFDAAVSKPGGWGAVPDPVAEIRRMRDGVPANVAALREDDANLSSWDGVDAQIDALKRLARTRVGGCECAMPCAEFADIVERLDAARKRELASTCNAAVTRRWLKTIRNMSEHNDNDLGNTVVRGLLDQLTRIHTCAREALSAPARNCDILSEEAANEAWDEYRHSHVLPRGGWDFRHIIRWLFAKAEGGEE